MTSDDLERKMKDPVRTMQGKIIEGIIDDQKPGLRSLSDLAKPAGEEASHFARAIDGLTKEGVLKVKPTLGGPAYDYNNAAAREKGYV